MNSPFNELHTWFTTVPFNNIQKVKNSATESNFFQRTQIWKWSMFRSKKRVIVSYLLRRRVSWITKRGGCKVTGDTVGMLMFILRDTWSGMGGVVSKSSTWNWSKNCSGIRTCNQSPWAAKCLPGPTRVPATRPVTNVTAVSKNLRPGVYILLKNLIPSC